MFGCPPKFIVMVRQLHLGVRLRIQNVGKFSEPCVGSNPVQLLFSLFSYCDYGIPIKYRFDGKLFNLRRLRAKPKVQRETFDDFLYADGMSIMPQQKGKCKKEWIEFHKVMIIMSSESAPRRLRLCITLHLEIHKMSLPSK